MKKIIIALVFVCFCLAGCRCAAQPKIILDADMGSSTDDVFAIRKLYQYISEGKCQLLGVVCDRKGAINARMTDVLLTYYNESFGIPKKSYPRIGWERDTFYSDKPRVFIDYCDVKNWDKDKNTWNDKSVWSKYKQGVANLDKLPTGSGLYRELLEDATIPDHSVTVVCIGFMTSLDQFLSNEKDRKLFERKVNKVYIMGSHFSKDYKSDWGYNLGNTSGKEKSVTPAYAARVLAKLQAMKSVRIIFSPSEVGECVGRYEVEDVRRDFKGSDDPLNRIYSMVHSGDDGKHKKGVSLIDENQYMWDVLPVIASVEGDDLFIMSCRGRVDIFVPDYTLVRCNEQSGFDEILFNSKIVFTPDEEGNVLFQGNLSFKGLKRLAETLTQVGR